MKKQNKKKKVYDAKNKNRVREIIVDLIRNKNINSILTLESPEFIFSKLLPDKKIIVFEVDGDIMTKMEKKCPKNVELVFGNINKFEIFNSQVDMIYLDFCKTWMTEQENIIKLKNSLINTKFFCLTLCLRESKFHKENNFVWKGDYQFDLLNKLQNITEINWRVIYGESYYDSVQMVTLILENPNALQ